MENDKLPSIARVGIMAALSKVSEEQVIEFLQGFDHILNNKDEIQTKLHEQFPEIFTEA